MYFAILENLVLFLLAGIGNYAIFTAPGLREHRRKQQVLIGLLMGMIALSVTSATVTLQSSSFQVSFKAGPLVLSGFLGGPLGGAITVLFATLSRLPIDPVLNPASLLIFAAIMGVGLLARRMAPSPDWPRIPPMAILAMLGWFLVLELAPMPLMAWTLLDEPSTSLLPKGLGNSAAGLLSIAALALILRLAAKIAHDEMMVSDLGDRLKFFLEAGKFGLFERYAGEPHVRYDGGLAKMYGQAGPDRQIEFDSWLDMVLPEDRDRVREDIRKVWLGASDAEVIEFRARRLDGEIRHMRLHRFVEYDARNTPKRVVGIQEDITGQRETEIQKSIVEARLERILENLPGAIISLDLSDPATGRVSYASPYVQQIWGYSAEEMLADPGLLYASLDPEDRKAFDASLEAARQARGSVSGRYRVAARNGEARWLDARIGISELPDGTLHGDGIILDATREVETRIALEEQKAVARRALRNESIGQLTGGVAHDFNNLLAVVMGNLELLRDDVSEPEQIRLIDSSLGAIERGANLTRSMLAFARQSHLEPQCIDLNALIAETRDWAGRTLPERIELTIALAPDLWSTRADPASTQSALLNLIVNARDAMPEGGQLSIGTGNRVITPKSEETTSGEETVGTPLVPGRYVVLEVADTGHGIALDQLRRIFEPFFTTKPPGSGSGLGLSMVQGFMQQTGGAVRLRSEPGKGTVFSLYFPASDATGRAAPTSADDMQQQALHGQRILLVEDEREVLEAVRSQLEKIGFRVMAASSGDAALALFRNDPTAFDLLLTDIVMPGALQGPALSEQMRRIRPDLPVIFLSGYAHGEANPESASHDDDIQLMKPVSRTELLEAIAKSVKR